MTHASNLVQPESTLEHWNEQIQCYLKFHAFQKHRDLLRLFMGTAYCTSWPISEREVSRIGACFGILILTSCCSMLSTFDSDIQHDGHLGDLEDGCNDGKCIAGTRSTDPAEVDGDPARQRSLTVQIDRASSGQPKVCGSPTMLFSPVMDLGTRGASMFIS